MDVAPGFHRLPQRDRSVLATAAAITLTGTMSPLILPLSCVSGVAECHDMHGVSIGWPELLLFLLVAAVVVGAFVLMFRSQRRR